MLLRLALENFVIIRRQELEFSAGMNVLTGETGAGKSILVDALGCLCGSRGSVEWIRHGSAKLTVEGTLDLAGVPASGDAVRRLGLDSSEGLLVLRRDLGRDGRSRCFANGSQILVSQLRELTSGLVWIVKQGEQRALADPDQQGWLLDRFSGTEDALGRYRTALRALLDSLEALRQARADRDAFASESDWLAFQAREIRAAHPAPGELARLRDLCRRLRSSRAEAGVADELRQRLFGDDGSVVDHLETVAHRLSPLEGEPWDALKDAILSLRDSVRGLEKMLPGDDPEDWVDPEAAEERLRLLERLCRKYGGSEETVLEHCSEVERRLDGGKGLDGRIAGMEKEIAELRRKTGEAGWDLSVSRRRGAEELARRVTGELEALDMAGASLRFEMASEQDPDGVPTPDGMLRPFAGGLERITLRFRPHPAEPEGDLGRVASGGELSRIFLALHSALGGKVPPGTWVLDEVDQGIGGETANRTGARLSRLSRSAQVLLVTHLPGIAARGDAHFAVRKTDSGGRPEARVERLDPDARLDELARMLSGDAAAAIARRHAAELLAEAGEKDGA